LSEAYKKGDAIQFDGLEHWFLDVKKTWPTTAQQVSEVVDQKFASKFSQGARTGALLYCNKMIFVL
jgi:hypothetical protein